MKNKEDEIDERYQFGKIYKLVWNLINMIYIGSTINELFERLRTHMNGYKLWKDGKKGYCSSYDYIEKYGKPEIILIEKYPCNNNEELRIRERYYQDQNRNMIINKNNAIRTDEDSKKTRDEYYGENREKILKEHQEYYNKNKDKINKKHHEYYNENRNEILLLRMEHYDENRDKILIKKKEYYNENREKILENGKIKINCECGSRVRISGKTRHLKSIKHQIYLASLIEIEFDDT